ncbi:MAG TPA: dihydropteroate synthase [Candidatus Omnitrophota bacterium]|nr:dihydropteroate synthase [Candidatus Omnitrophota bacterium]
MIRVIRPYSSRELIRLMREIDVDGYGISIMAPKGVTCVIRIDSLSNIAANIIKQEMLSVGADAAIARGSLTGSVKKTGCLLMGTICQYKRLCQKLLKQPFGLQGISLGITRALQADARETFTFKAGKGSLRLGSRTRIMGILNCTPDSFSGDGLYNAGVEAACEYGRQLVKDGADCLDVGGESTRPGSAHVSLQEELRRVIPVVKQLAKKIKIPISIDTHKPEVAKAALDNGACIVNDIFGFRSEKMIEVAARYRAGVVIMHMQGNPQTMQQAPHYKRLMPEILDFLKKSVDRCIAGGIRQESIVIDPGIGFGKTLGQNLSILKHLRELKVLGLPLLVGPSRKSFIGAISNTQPQDRVYGSIAASLAAASNGCHMVRVHDVAAVRQALAVADSIRMVDI